MQSFNEFEFVAQELKNTGEVTTLTAGPSMQPMLRQHRDVVVIKRVDCPIKKGDVVLYPCGTVKYLLHRVIAVKNGRYIIRGDNNYFTEKNIDPNSIIGILKEFYRDGKYINIDTNKRYKLYTFYILHSYAIRYFWKKIILPVLVKLKHTVFK